MNTSPYQEGDAPQLYKDRSSYPRDCPQPHPTYIFTGLFIVSFSQPKCYKLVNRHASLSSMLSSSKRSNPKGDKGMATAGL